ADLEKIVELLLADLQLRLAQQEIEIDLTPAARGLIVRDGTAAAYGARPLKRTIQRLVENPLARALVAGEFRPGDRVTADADIVNGTVVFPPADAAVVSGASRRDARNVPDADEPAAVGAGRGRSGSPLDLPP